MLRWFKDAALLLPVDLLTPKWVSIPTKGASKTSSLWLGDAYTAIVSQPVAIAATTIFLSQTDELPTTGTIKIDTDVITYTGVTATPASITGCSGVTATHTVGTIAFPQITYTSSGNITALVAGMSGGPTQLSLSTPTGVFGPPGVPALFSTSTILSGAAGALQVNIKVTAPAGPEAQYVNLSINVTPFTRPGDVATGFTTITVQPVGSIYVQQRDQGLGQRLRLLPLSRKVNNNLPGFTWGDYRWRDTATENAVAVVPTRWDIDTTTIQQDFIGGVGSIGDTNDLQPIDLEELQSSIFLRAQRGQYFTGVNRYYLPSGNFNLEFLPCYPGLPFTYQLLNNPRSQTPVFVGTWIVDGQGFYEYGLKARYRFPGTFSPTATEPQFMVDRTTGLLTVNSAVQVPQATILLGVLSGGINESFDMPTYPLDKIVRMFVGNPTLNITNYVFDRENGNVSFAKIPGTSQGQPLFAVVDAAIAVLYEYDVNDDVQIQNAHILDESILRKNTCLLTPDLNPAFSGLSSGVVYLQHRVLRPVAVTLSADKPQIPIPPTLASIIGLIAYGPVFYNGDHALLTATAIGSLPNEVIPGAQLEVIPGGLNPNTGLPLQSTTFRGTINGLDPNTNNIVVTTGGDGIANLVYQPVSNFGFYIPPTAPWVTASVTFVPTASTWSAGVATITVPIPLSSEFVVGSSVRLAGFTPGAWNGDYAITKVDVPNHQFQIFITSNPGVSTVQGTVGPLDTLLLPTPIPISQIWAGPPNNEGWLEFVYAVLSNDPLFGLTGGNPAQGQVPFVTNGTVNGSVTITNASWAASTSTFTLASSPTNLVVGQNINVIGCTMSGLNGFQNVKTIFQVGPTWFITATTNTVGSGSEAEGGASFQYSNFRSNGVLSVWNKALPVWKATNVYQLGYEILDSNGNLEIVTSVSGTGTSAGTVPVWSTTFGATTTDNPGGNQVVWTNAGKPGQSVSIPNHAYDRNGNDYTAGGFDGNVVRLVFNQGLPNPSQGFVQAYMFQFLEREIIQLRVKGTNILSNSIMLQMETPQQIFNNPYLVLSTDQTHAPFYAGSSANSRFNINRLGIVPPVIGAP